jgi:exopolyphosphatase/guanosine-5'-triphosphate,3'-diphosphate pyrophosphatase
MGRELAREMVITRLGEGVDASGTLKPSAVARTTAVLSRFAASIARHRATRVRAAATSATRDAANGAMFLQLVERILGVRPELLSGEQEAALGFRGATAGLARERGPFLVVDIGGGSTELVLGVTEPEAAISIDVGCVRMTERCLHGDPPTASELATCIQVIRQELAAVRGAVDIGRARCVVGTAGTVTTMAALALGLDRYDARRTHHFVLARADVEAQLIRLQSASVEARRTMLAEPGRADVIVGGAIVLATLMRELELAELLVSEHDILDGLAMSLR